jgi:hypothetical protein
VSWWEELKGGRIWPLDLCEVDSCIVEADESNFGVMQWCGMRWDRIFREAHLDV